MYIDAYAVHDSSRNVAVIAKTMRKNRQEDSHEFLRYAIDAFQKSCLAGYPQSVLSIDCAYYD